MSNVIIIGASGHAKVIVDLVLKTNNKLLGFLDDNKTERILDYKILGKISDIEKFKNNASFVIGIGSNKIRKEIANKYKLNWITLIHPTAQIGMKVHIDEGTVIMANVVINTETKIGKHCIINTGAIVEHDNVIEDYVHLSPNSTLCGTVKIGSMTHIGASATVINNVNICNNCIIGAGSVVIKNINEKGVYVGVPAKKIKDIERYE